MKRIIKKSLLFIWARIFKNSNSKIIYYHDVYGKKQYTNMGTSLAEFEEHINIINKAGFQIVGTIDERVGQVSIMFDDGFQGIFDLKDWFINHGITPTVFIAVDLIGKEGYLNETEILELQDHGFIFQCHSWSHEDLTLFNDEELYKELFSSKQYLEKLLNKEVNGFCFPKGYFSDHIVELCLKYGYKELYSSIPGDYFKKEKGILRTRNLVQTSSKSELSCILHGGLNYLKMRARRLHHK